MEPAIEVVAAAMAGFLGSALAEGPRTLA